MTNAKAKAKTKAIRMPGKKRPAASRLVIQRPPTTEPHLRACSRFLSCGRAVIQVDICRGAAVSIVVKDEIEKAVSERCEPGAV
jgi:hypothetical protein